MESLKNQLPEDVIIHILLRLPVMSLLRFRCICIAWCKVIKSPDFIAMHFNHPIVENDHHVLIKRCFEDEVTSALSVHSNTKLLNILSSDIEIPPFDHEDIELLGPCNGLVCITDYETIVLCNPAMREFTLLPDRPFGCPPDMRYSCEGVGFGFDVSTNDYKIVRIVNLEDDADYHDIRYRIVKAEVYQCGTNSWREIDAALPDLRYAPCFEIFFHGATHWYAKGGPTGRVLSFCITNEVFQEFDFPEGCSTRGGKCKSLTVLNESLAMLSYTNPQGEADKQFIDVWTMREYGVSVSWTKELTIGPLSKISLPITSWKNSAILLERTNGQLISCAIDTQEVKEFDIFGYPSTLRALVYKESLVSTRK